MPKKSGSRRKSASPWKKAIRNTLIVLFVLMAAGAFAGTIFFTQVLNEAAQKVQNLPELVQASRGEPTVIVSSDGKTLLKLATEFRKEVNYADLPERVKMTTLAAEDIRFLEHRGVDVVALGRIFFKEMFARKETTGGSTLTMQLAKLNYTSAERSFTRKLKDMALALKMEELLTKEQILEFYLNTVYYGEGAYGVGAAADSYFGKKLDKLTLAEAALLSRLVRRPSYENPRVNLQKAINNRNVVLKILFDEGKISSDEYEEATSEDVKLAPERVRMDGTTGKVSPFFVDYVLREVRKALPDADIKQGGYRIETTLNQELQGKVEREMDRTIDGYRSIRTGAAVVLDRSGRIKAMYGGPDYRKDQYNGATQGKRQPGSSFKSFVYLVAAQNGLARNAYASVDNSTQSYRDGGRMWSPKGGGPNGTVSLRSAIANSYNKAAVSTIVKVGPDTVVRFARQDLGFESELPAVKSLALGSCSVSPLEMAQAYSVFPLRGRRADAYGIERIIGPNGMPVYGDGQTIRQTSFGERAVDVIDECLRAVVTSGTGRAASGIRNARGKTGTTNDNRDAWFCGYTDEYVAVVWFANPIKKGKSVVYEEMGPAVMGGKVGAPTWAAIMRQVHGTLGQEKDTKRSSTREREPDPDEEAARERSPDPDDSVEPTVPEAGSEAGAREREGTKTPPTTPTTEERDPASTPEGAPAATRPKTDPPAAPPKTPDREVKAESVTVEICADSGQRATVYCPERVTRTFPKGREPKGRCPLNHRD